MFVFNESTARQLARTNRWVRGEVKGQEGFRGRSAPQHVRDQQEQWVKFSSLTPVTGTRYLGYFSQWNQKTESFIDITQAYIQSPDDAPTDTTKHYLGRFAGYESDGLPVFVTHPPGPAGLSAGCGIHISGNTISVNNSDLNGHGITNDSTAPCGLQVNVGCGLKFDVSTPAHVIVDNTALAGNGLTPSGTCALSLNVGCGLTFTGGKVIVNSVDLAGQGLIGQGTCGLAVNIGCGLKFDAASPNHVLVDNTALAGGGLVTSGTCSLAVKTGCGVKLVNNAVTVDNTVLQGPGLVPSGTCGLQVNTGCGIEISGNAVTFNPSDVAGTGSALSVVGTCGLKVNTGCGLWLGGPGGNTVQVFAPDLSGQGLRPDTSTSCGLMVNVGCGIRIVNDAVTFSAADVAGPGLQTTGTCGLEVKVGCGIGLQGGAVTFDPIAAAGFRLTPGGQCSSSSCSLDWEGLGGFVQSNPNSWVGPRPNVDLYSSCPTALQIAVSDEPNISNNVESSRCPYGAVKYTFSLNGLTTNRTRVTGVTFDSNACTITVTSTTDTFVCGLLTG